MKRTAILLVAAVVGTWMVRPKCGTTASVAVTRSAPRVEMASAAMPAVIESFTTAERFAPRRDVFAFRSVSVEDRRSHLSSLEGQVGAPVLHKDAEITVVRPPDSPPAYRYLGSFGPQTNPLLVFKGNAAGDIVNIQILKKP